MAAFWRREITLRKLRVLLENLPEDAPTRWHSTDGRPFSLTNRLLWIISWAISVAAIALTGGKDGKKVFEGMPSYPWSDSGKNKKFGSAGGRSHNEIMAYLDAMGGGAPDP